MPDPVMSAPLLCSPALPPCPPLVTGQCLYNFHTRELRGHTGNCTQFTDEEIEASSYNRSGQGLGGLRARYPTQNWLPARLGAATECSSCQLAWVPAPNPGGCPQGLKHQSSLFVWLLLTQPEAPAVYQLWWPLEVDEALSARRGNWSYVWLSGRAGSLREGDIYSQGTGQCQFMFTGLGG